MDTAIYALEMLLLGAGVGLISSVLGLGGGILMVPAFLIFVDGMDPHTAKGSSLLIITFVAAQNAWRQNVNVHTPWTLAALLASGSIVGGYLGAWLTHLLPGRMVILLFVALMAVTAWRTFLIKPINVDDQDVRERRALAILIGLATGLVSGATGTGGGGVLVPLTLIAGLTTNRRVVALSNLVMVATAAASTLAHLLAQPTTVLPYTLGTVHYAIAPMVFLGAVLSSFAGRRLNERVSLNARKAILGVLLLIIAARLLWQAFAG